jgi:hypothetical protein
MGGIAMQRIRENDKERYGWDQDTGKLIHIDKKNDDNRESLDSYQNRESAEKALDTTVRWGLWGKPYNPGPDKLQ